jgi:hypothetical protein
MAEISFALTPPSSPTLKALSPTSYVAEMVSPLKRKAYESYVDLDSETLRLSQPKFKTNISMRTYQDRVSLQTVARDTITIKCKADPNPFLVSSN